MTRSVLAGPRWRRTSRGFYVPADDEGRTDPEATPTPTQRILDVTLLVPKAGAIGGWAAAFVCGVDHLDGRDPYLMAPLPILVYQGKDTGRQTIAGVTFSREQLPPSDVEQLHGTTWTTRLRTAFDGGRLAPCLAEGVAFVDACAHHRLVDLEELGAYTADHPRWRGVEQARLAVSLADPAARNPWESRLRMCYMLEADLPRPEVNRPLFDRDGNLLGMPDLLDEEAALAVEFDGEGHRRRRQHRGDNVREEGFESAGLTVVRADSLDLRDHRPELIRRLHSGRHRGLRRDRGYDSWTTVEPQWWLDAYGTDGLLTDGEKAAILGQYDG